MPPTVHLETNHGRIVIELDPKRAPVSTENFLAYVDSSHYDGLAFHRVIPGFMVQGGGYTADLEKRRPLRDPIRNEADNDRKNERGTVAMARSGEPHSATSQFFFNLVDNVPLDHVGPESGRTFGYAVFGKVVEGLDVVDAIAALPTRPRGSHGHVPKEPAVIEKATVVSRT